MTIAGALHLVPNTLDFGAPGARLALEFTVPASDEALADYDAAKHAQAFATRAPVVQFLFKDDGPQGYAELQKLAVVSARIAVDVSGVRSLELQSDAGLIDPRSGWSQRASASKLLSRYGWRSKSGW